MDEVDLSIPEPLLDSLPADGDATRQDMHRAVTGLEERINHTIYDAEDDAAAVNAILNVVDHMESRGQRYDEFVPELRAWGQSPIYAVAWRNLYADIVAQLADHDGLADRLERERNARLVEEGIRLQDIKDD